MELNTRTKMFCRCPNISKETMPNTNVCPICLGHPGTMPFANKKAIESILKLGIALGGEIPDKSQFDRKSYFYPDLPKGYQISQFEHPFIKGGELAGVKITRIHLEEDAGKLLHTSDGSTLCDYNRAGVALMELVTEPDIESGEEAVKFTKELQVALRYLGISNADMEKGEMRLEANISVRPENTDKLGTKVEVKNLNSFKFMGDAINYEIKRQVKELEKGNKILQETRGWDSRKGQTFSQRGKEEAHDYRYLPEPDIPPYDFTDKDFMDIEAVRRDIPELPREKKERFMAEFGLPESLASSFAEVKQFASYYEEVVSEIMSEDIGEDEKKKCLILAANYMVGGAREAMNQEGTDTAAFKEKVAPENMADLIILILKGDLSSRMAKDILAEMHETGLDPREIIKRKGIKQVSDEDAVTEAVRAVMEENPKAVEDYKKGKQNALQFLFGQTMAKLKGQGNPEVIRRIFKKNL